jgi:hypothetical protein
MGSALRSRSDSFGRRQRIAKPSLTQAVQNKRGATLARYQGHAERGLQNEHQNDAKPASGLNFRGDLPCVSCAASQSQ